jgi:Escherichia/Staphylococcus phage prohead protease
MIADEPRVFDPDVVQHRTVTLQNLEVRSGEDGGDPPMIRGYAAVFNEWAEIIPGLFRERIAQGAFRKTIGEADVRALVNHDPNYVLGRNRAGTLSLAEDKHGLAVEIEPPDAQWARDLMVSMKRGDISQMSFGFRPVKWTEEDNGPNQPLDVTLQEARLFDVSVVTFPAYPQTEAWARSAIASISHYLLSEPSNHSTEVPVTRGTEPGDHSEPEPNSWQSEIAEIQAWLESEP